VTNTRFALAVHALTLLADSAPRRVSSEEMSGSTGSNPVHLRRVLGVLRSAGLVVSRPGVSGGWTLAIDPATTTLADVWRAVNTDAPVLSLHGADPGCRVGQSVQRALVEIDRDVTRSILDELALTTLADLHASVPA